MNPSHIVHTARGWLGTRFHHQGRLKKTATHKGGVDCLGLIVGVAKELDLRSLDGRELADYDEQNYSHYPDADHLFSRLTELLRPIKKEETQPADIILLNIDSHPQHLAIVSDFEAGKGIIHAFAPARSVVEHALDSYWEQKIVNCFRLKAYNN
ncbi:MAG: hypothetical protein LW823_02305 [Rickettsiales bacterium]|jgi:cell wall-associated NlpC family hydrolase|nr:hypothetical protein [Rickettsiales bacterium]